MSGVDSVPVEGRDVFQSFERGDGKKQRDKWEIQKKIKRETHTQITSPN